MLKNLKLRSDIDKNKKILKETREEEKNLKKQEKELETKIKECNENTPKEIREEIDTEIEELEKKKEETQQKILDLEQEIEELEKELKELEEKQKQAINNNAGEEGRDYKGMKNIILRNREDKLFNKMTFTPDERDLNLGKYIRGMVTGKWKEAEMEKREFLTSGASSLIPRPLYAQIVDKARNVSIFGASSVPTVLMETNNLSLAKIKEDLKAEFKEEGKEGKESTPLELESLVLKSKTIYGYAYVSLEAIESAENLDSILIESFGKSVAESIDKAMLYGVYSTDTSSFVDYAPSGIFNNTNINKITASGSNYDDIIKGIGAIKNYNGLASHIVMNAKTEETLSLLKDTTEQYITPPQAVKECNKLISNQLNYETSAGSDILIFNPSSLIIGIQKELNIRMFEGDTESIKKGLVCFRIYSMIDCQVIQPKHICKIEGFGKA